MQKMGENAGKIAINNVEERIYEEIKGRPKYIVSTSCESKKKS